MENENKTLLDKIKDEITTNGGLASTEIATKFLGVKSGGIAAKILVDKILKENREFFFDGEKWQIQILISRWEKATFTKSDFEKEPTAFGVFGFYDKEKIASDKKIIFVGSGTNLREELLSLWAQQDGEPEQIKKLRELAVSYITSPCKDDMSAIDTEMKLIQKHKPVLNM